MKSGVLIVEDHHGMRDGLSYIVSNSSQYQLTDAVATGEAALDSIQDQQPDIVMMDINMPGIGGIEATRKIKSLYPDIKVLICTVHEDEDKIFNALAAGATGYILKKSSPQQILEALDELSFGGSPISSSVARKMVDFFQQNRKQSTLTENLSDREMEVLSLLSAGYRNKEIGEKLFLSLPTVKSHIYNIYKKLHVQTRVAAVNIFKSKDGLRR